MLSFLLNHKKLEAEELSPLPFNETERTDVVSDFTPSPPFLPQSNLTEMDEDESDPRTFNPKIYEDLPEPLSSALECAKNEDDKMVLLIGSLVAISSTMTEKVWFYYQKRYRPNLLAFVVSPPGNGKGRTSLPPMLVEEIHQEHMQRTSKQMAEYKNAMELWSKAGRKSGTPPEKPKIRLLKYPSNITGAALENLVADNDGNGLLFSPDIASIMTAFFAEHGNIIPDLLATAENESLTRARKVDFELIEVPETRFSVLVDGTIQYVFKLLGDGSDGLHSRFIFIFIKTGLLWQSQWQTNGKETDDEIFRRLGMFYKTLYEKLKSSDGVEFELTDDQKSRFDARFEDWANMYATIYGNRILSSVRRMAVIALRIMCVISILRALNQPDEMPSKVLCSDEDFERALSMVKTLLVHTGYSFSLLSEPTKKYCSKGWERLIHALPDCFKRSEAIKIAQGLGITTKRTDKYLHRLCEEGKITKVEHGIYQKVK